MVTTVSLYTSSTEELKLHILIIGSSTVNKTFLKSREKFLRYATTKFGNDLTFSLAKQRVELMYRPSPSTT